MEPIFVDSAASLGRTLFIGVIGYIGIALLLRISGKRSLSKLNMFDFVVTIALGSVLAAMLTAKSVALAQGLIAVAVLLFLQWCVTFTAARSSRFDQLVKAEPRLLFHKGEFLRDAMRAERIAESELYAAARDSSCGDLGRVHAMVLESDGTISVIPEEQAGDGSAIPEHFQAHSLQASSLGEYGAHHSNRG
ncbi:DUF421 domain-containing protein [Parvularcula lutaonensis]|uniref:DUF421 domain-containing protein n=1 Tax=Parvularcula lutaonensis TaxID=491923 RepID=A0ABV7MC05_9PROT|nr:YetF domain-containing protein [Parvularcula lutaonensis]GGY49607.1 DUF421 domain-containing protein [Parvularcula lutaonensis]